MRFLRPIFYFGVFLLLMYDPRVHLLDMLTRILKGEINLDTMRMLAVTVFAALFWGHVVYSAWKRDTKEKQDNKTGSSDPAKQIV